MDETILIQYKEGGEGKIFCAEKGAYAPQKVPSWIMDETILVQYKRGGRGEKALCKKRYISTTKSSFMDYGRNNTV